MSCVQHISSQARKHLDYCLCGLFLGFRSRGRNRCRRIMVHCFGLRLGKDNFWIRFVNKPCTTTAYLLCPRGLTLSSQNVVVCRNDICKNCCCEVHGHFPHQADVCTVLSQSSLLCTRRNSDLSEHVRIRHVHS